MKWAFWRRRKPRATRPGRTQEQQGETAAGSEESAADLAGARVVHAAQLRVRMRRRLIGAAALLLGTAVVVPMMLDPAPRPLPDNIPIDIPSERTPFTPRLSLPPAAPSSAPGAAEGKPGAAPPPTASDAPESAEAGSPAEAAGAKAPAAKAGQWFVQAAALSSESAARQLAERLTKAGMTPFVERTGNGGSVLYRVRLGPFATRDAAVKVRRHLHAMAVGSNVVRVEQAER
ncbi:MAG TPA: SPOR domain-containing protein [Burkholderiaceae bacterium]|nr:SPOR domain-containing protein [Burkholderiaceae bacterium]